jgi:hypothetical protein
MPVCYEVKEWNGWNIQACPSDIRQVFGLLPFFWGSDISYNLLFKSLTGKPRTIGVRLKWQLTDSDNTVIKSGKGVVDTQIARIKQNKYKAIMLGRLHTTEQYLLKVSFANINDTEWSEYQEMAEFTLKDREDFNISIINLLGGAVAGAIAGGVIAWIMK